MAVLSLPTCNRGCQ